MFNQEVGLANQLLIPQKAQKWSKEAIVYSPKISDDLIPQLYHLAKARGIPMTHLVNELLKAGLQKVEGGTETANDPPIDYQPTNPKRKGGEK